MTNKIVKWIDEKVFGKIDREFSKTRIKFKNTSNKTDLINELEEVLSTLPYNYSLSETENQEFISLLRKNSYDDSEKVAIERMKINYEIASQHFSNLNNVIIYLTIIFGFISPIIIDFVLNSSFDLNLKLAFLGITLIIIVILYITIILRGFKLIEVDHRKLTQVSKYIDLITRTT